jgi:hypothetical protein|tara:strand:+ start:309 stop:617 length:309 start_codon:yes stop_codon:yes gene_type:complete
MKDKFIPFEKWSFVDRNDLDTEHWYIRLEGGEYNEVIYRYLDVKLNDTTKSINFDYEIVEFPMETPHGDPQFNEAAGNILQSILADTMEKQDFVLGPKNKGE